MPRCQYSARVCCADKESRPSNFSRQAASVRTTCIVAHGRIIKLCEKIFLSSSRSAHTHTRVEKCGRFKRTPSSKRGNSKAKWEERSSKNIQFLVTDSWTVRWSGFLKNKKTISLSSWNKICSRLHVDADSFRNIAATIHFGRSKVKKFSDCDRV